MSRTIELIEGNPEISKILAYMSEEDLFGAIVTSDGSNIFISRTDMSRPDPLSVLMDKFENECGLNADDAMLVASNALLAVYNKFVAV